VRAARDGHGHAIDFEGACERGVYHRAGQKAQHQHAREAADAVNAEHVQRIVVAADGLDLRDRRVADDAGDEADAKGRRNRDETGCRCDRAVGRLSPFW